MSRSVSSLPLAAALLSVLLLLTGCPDPAPPSPTPPAPPPEEPPPVEPPPEEPPVPPPPTANCDATRTGAPGGRSIEDRMDTLPPSGRIVGGVDAAQGAWPWAAAIVFPRAGGSFFQYCGGSLIAPDWVLTAAHCEVDPGDKVILGRNDLTGGGGEVIDVSFVLSHSDYDGSTNDNDIALIKLASPSSAQTVALIDAAETAGQPGAPATIVGWGALAEGGQASPTALQQVEVPIRTNADCQLGYTTTITANMVCAGLDAGQLDSCQGDSGGPLMVRGSPQASWEQAGIVSFGIGCARPNTFGVYTRVARYLDWVDACQANPP